MDEGSAYNYIRGKFELWSQIDGSPERHVPVIGGKEKVRDEFLDDLAQLRITMCPYIREVGYDQSKNLILRAAEGIAGYFFNFPLLGTADLVMAALIEACGYSRHFNDIT